MSSAQKDIEFREEMEKRERLRQESAEHQTLRNTQQALTATELELAKANERARLAEESLKSTNNLIGKYEISLEKLKGELLEKERKIGLLQNVSV